MRKKYLAKINGLESRVVELISDNVYLSHRVDKHMLDIEKLEGYLIEAGILEKEWKPEAPKGSSITSNFTMFDPTYTKINKIWD
jgi:hypothetical protein